MWCRATQDGQVMVESSDKVWSTGEGNGKPLQYSCLENPKNSMKGQKDRTLKGELLRSVGAHYATGGQWRSSSRKNEEMEPKQKQHPVVDVTGDGSRVRCCKEQGCIGTWNVSVRKRRGKKEPPLRTVDEGLYWAVALGQNSRGRVSEETKGVCEVWGVGRGFIARARIQAGSSHIRKKAGPTAAVGVQELRVGTWLDQAAGGRSPEV